MKLYTNLFSPNARKVHAVAHELGIDLDTQTVDLRDGEQRSAEYLASRLWSYPSTGSIT